MADNSDTSYTLSSTRSTSADWRLVMMQRQEALDARIDVLEKNQADLEGERRMIRMASKAIWGLTVMGIVGLAGFMVDAVVTRADVAYLQERQAEDRAAMRDVTSAMRDLQGEVRELSVKIDNFTGTP